MENNSKKLIKRLKKYGWVLDNVNGGHHIFRHPKMPGTISITHHVKDVSDGMVRAIYKAAGWR